MNETPDTTEEIDTPAEPEPDTTDDDELEEDDPEAEENPNITAIEEAHKRVHA